MSISEIQSRTHEIDLRLRQLFGGPPTAATPVTTAAPADASTFSDSLQAAVGATAVAPPAVATLSATTASTAGTADIGAQVVAVAQRYLGTPYKWGGSTPSTGFDCSGLVQWSYQQLGISLPRVAADQARQGTAVTAAQARPGDLVFFGSPVDHVGIYAGAGKMVVAPHTGDVVKMQSVDLSTATAIRRIAPAPAAGGGAVTAPGLAALPVAGKPYGPAITAAADAAGIPPALLGAVAWSESAFNPSAVSPAGAVGLVQLMPATAASLGVDPRDPTQALNGAARYLAQQLQTFGGRTDLAVAAYNAGPGAVRRYGGVPPYSETQAYVATVMSHYRTLGGVA